MHACPNMMRDRIIISVSKKKLWDGGLFIEPLCQPHLGSSCCGTAGDVPEYAVNTPVTTS